MRIHNDNAKKTTYDDLLLRYADKLNGLNASISEVGDDLLLKYSRTMEALSSDTRTKFDAVLADSAEKAPARYDAKRTDTLMADTSGRYSRILESSRRTTGDDLLLRYSQTLEALSIETRSHRDAVFAGTDRTSPEYYAKRFDSLVAQKTETRSPSEATSEQDTLIADTSRRYARLAASRKRDTVLSRKPSQAETVQEQDSVFAEAAQKYEKYSLIAEPSSSKYGEGTCG